MRALPLSHHLPDVSLSVSPYQSKMISTFLKRSKSQRISNSMSGRAHKLEPRLYKRTLSRPVAKELTLLRRALGVHSTTICSNLFSQSQLTISTRFYRIISSERLKVNAVSTVSAFCVHFPLNLEMMPSKTFEGPQQKSASHLHATSSRLPIDSFSRQFPLL